MGAISVIIVLILGFVLFALLASNPVGQIILYGTVIYVAYQIIKADFGSYKDSEQRPHLYPTVLASIVTALLIMVIAGMVIDSNSRCNGYYTGLGAEESAVRQTGINISSDSYSSVCGFSGTSAACREYNACKEGSPLSNPKIIILLMLTLVSSSVAVSFYPKNKLIGTSEGLKGGFKKVRK